jgi:hypothetical protein
MGKLPHDILVYVLPDPVLEEVMFGLSLPPALQRYLPYLKFFIALAGLLLSVALAFPLPAALALRVSLAVQLVAAFGVFFGVNRPREGGNEDPVKSESKS